MNTREKAAFLRAEKWKAFGLFSWVDPVSNLIFPIEKAYPMALRRKAAHESRRLKATGCAYTIHYGWRRKSSEPHQGYFVSRSEALKQLGIK